jgi:hypothetical protein
VIDAETLEILERIAVAIERVADHLAPKAAKAVRQPATLSTATYSREERERQELRDTLHKKTSKLKSRITSPVRPDSEPG